MMSKIFVLVFHALIIDCLAEGGQENLQPLKYPEGLKMNEDLSTLRNLFRDFNINFLKNQFSTPSGAPTILDRMWSSTTQMLNPNYWIGTDPYAKACDYMRIKGKIVVKKEGYETCLQKCSDQNKDYVKYIKEMLPHLFRVMNKPELEADFEARNENIYNCAPGLIYGVTCICKHNLAATVNQPLQDMIDDVFRSKKNQKQSTDPKDMAKAADSSKSDAVGRFLGLIAISIYFPKFLYPYIAWWMNGFE